MAADGTGISRRAYAESREISEATVRKYLKQGKLSDALLPDGTLDAKKADRLLASSISRGRNQPVELRTAKARRLRAQIRTLEDRVKDLRRSLVRADRVQPIVRESLVILCSNLRPLGGKIVPTIAGMSGKAAHMALREAVYDALDTISSTMLKRASQRKVQKREELELDHLGEAHLLAVQANLQAEKLELERGADQAILRSVSDALEEYEEKMAVSKSLVLAMPGRVSPYAEGERAEQLQERIDQELEQAIAVFGPNEQVSDAEPGKLDVK